jgi:hypothetical protein
LGKQVCSEGVGSKKSNKRKTHDAANTTLWHR